MNLLRKIVRYFVTVNPMINLLAFIIAIITIYIARDQTRSIRNVNDFITTRSLKSFPNNLTNINQFLTKEIDNQYKKQVIICLDFSGYGMFSSNNSFKTYKSLLQQLITKSSSENYQITYLCYNEKITKMILEEQFKSDSIEDLKTRQFREFIYESEERPDSVYKSVYKNKSSFEDFIFEKDKSVFDAIKGWATHNKSCQILKYSERLPCYLWYCDGEAILSFPNLEDIEEHAIFTRDTKLIRFFLGRIGFEYDEENKIYKINENCDKIKVLDINT